MPFLSEIAACVEQANTWDCLVERYVLAGCFGRERGGKYHDYSVGVIAFAGMVEDSVEDGGL